MRCDLKERTACLTCGLTRIIRQPLGNALLLGVGGSGRRSLAMLAAFMCDYDVIQMEIAKGYGNNEWREVGAGGESYFEALCCLFILATVNILQLLQAEEI